VIEDGVGAGMGGETVLVDDGLGACPAGLPAD
jgi:hypothetical protein